MHSTIYKCENDNINLELGWSKDGIHFYISRSDGGYITDITLTEYDIRTMIDELEIYADALAEESKKS